MQRLFVDEIVNCPNAFDQIHNYNTRNSHAFHLPYCRTNFKRFSVFFSNDPNFEIPLTAKSPTLFQSVLSRKLLRERLLMTMGNNYYSLIITELLH